MVVPRDPLLDLDEEGLRAYAVAALAARKIESTPPDNDRLTRWLVRARAACAPWAAAAPAGQTDFDRALRDGAADR